MAETEARLKSHRIEPALRSRIHRAIDRSVAFLRSQQRESGSFRGGYRTEQFRTGMNALCALALRHADTKVGREGAARGIAWLAGKTGKGRKATLRGSYTGGVTLMLLAADRSHHEWGRRIAHQIATSIRPGSGWWGYGIRGPRNAASNQSDLANLSTTQFAALGLWAGSQLGAPSTKKVWRKHLEALIRHQLPSGSWNYFPTMVKPRSGYATGTFMGFANLMLCLAALKDELVREPGLAKRVLRTRLMALAALRKDGRASLEALASAAHPNFYDLYALEKACVFGNLATLGDLPWYQVGAENLVLIQNPDGGWSGGAGLFTGRGQVKGLRSGLANTAFGLLFLLRASEVYHPVAPRSVGPRPEAPVTPPAGPK